MPLAHENKICDKNDFRDHMNKLKRDTYTQNKKLLSDWSDKENYMIHYRMAKLYVRHGMGVEKSHEIISFKQSKWLEKYTNFNTRKRYKANNE